MGGAGMRFLVVGALVGLDALVIYLGGADFGFISTLVTVILVAVWLAYSFARDGMWSDGQKGNPGEEGTDEGDRMVHRSRARPP